MYLKCIPQDAARIVRPIWRADVKLPRCGLHMTKYGLLEQAALPIDGARVLFGI